MVCVCVCVREIDACCFFSLLFCQQTKHIHIHLNLCQFHAHCGSRCEVTFYLDQKFSLKRIYVASRLVWCVQNRCKSLWKRDGWFGRTQKCIVRLFAFFPFGILFFHFISRVSTFDTEGMDRIDVASKDTRHN